MYLLQSIDDESLHGYVQRALNKEDTFSIYPENIKSTLFFLRKLIADTAAVIQCIG